jgi:hypothetical protein
MIVGTGTSASSLSGSGIGFAQDMSQNQTTTEPFVSFTKPIYPFTLQYPQNWAVEEKSNGVWFRSPVDESGNFRIGFAPAYNASLSSLVAIHLKELQNSFKDFKISNSTSTPLDGAQANVTNYFFSLEDNKLFNKNTYQFVGTQYAALKNNTFYSITYFSSPENFGIFLPIVEKMISTLKIK